MSGLVGQQVEKLVEALRCRVVGAGRSHHIEPLEAQALLERPQGIDLAGNADDGEALEAPRPRWLQESKERRISHPHAPALRHALGLGDEDGNRPPFVLGVGRHRQHSLDRACFEKALGDAGRDPGPLCARAGL